MRLFKKKEKFIDLRDKVDNSSYLNLNSKKEEVPEEKNTFGFLSNLASSSSNSNEEPSSTSVESSEEKKKRLTKRLLDITQKIESLSNSVYHLEQRIDVLEKKSRINDFN